MDPMMPGGGGVGLKYPNELIIRSGDGGTTI